jgi:flagellar basal-body rod protein FlgB
MELFDTTQIGLEAALRGAAAKQRAIASNIANVNTPGYKRVDVNFAGALDDALRSGDRAALESFSPRPQVDDAAGSMRLDGNAVDLDTEAAEQAANGLHYEAIVSVMRARLGILQTALGTGS